MSKPLTLVRRVCLFTVLSAILCFSLSACSKHHEPKFDKKSMTERYEDWQKKYGRRYAGSDEWNKRFRIYQSNVEFIDYTNSLNLPYNLTDNEFADMTNEEFRSRYIGKKLNNTYSCDTKGNSAVHHHKLPRFVDWRLRGAVNPVRNQGTCQSCWSFSAIATIEAINKIKTGRLLDLSEQMLIDCARTKTNKGCNTGFMEPAFDFIRKNGGITTERDYMYTGKDGQCKSNKLKNHAATITGYKNVPKCDEKALQAVVANQPVAVGIEAFGKELQHYSSGVFTGKCGKQLDHAVNIVGYGEENGRKYWLVRNTWGPGWGIGGYIKMHRESNREGGMCGITLLASYPLK